MAKRLNNNVIGLVGDSASEWINKINDGSKDHSIAVEKGITFFNGKNDDTGVKWDGVQELEVIIPTLADIVSNPVTLKGILDAPSDVPKSASNGDLYYIGTSGSYFNPAVACEAGDMAVYYNGAWHVIQGENQVSLAGTDLSIGTSKTNVITVEGQTLALSLNVGDIDKAIVLTKNPAGVDIDLDEGATVTVPSTYVALTQASGSKVTIGVEKSINLPTALADGTVNLTNNTVLVPDDFTWSAGTLPEASREAVSVSISHNLSISKANANDGATGDYVTSVDAIGSAVIAEGTQGDGIKYVSGITASTGTTFLTGVHPHTEDDTDAAAFTVYGAVTAAAVDNTFATGFVSATSTDDDAVVSSVTIGGVSGEFVTGLSNASSVITSVVFGDATLSNDRQWFLTGLTEGSKVVTDVNFGTVEVTPQTSAAVVSASVSNHVLSFTTGNFMTSATAALSGTGVTTKEFTRGGIALTGFSSSSDVFTKASVIQADSTISYKKLATAAVSLTQSSTAYHYDKAASSVYSEVFGYVKVSTNAASVSKNTPVLANTTLTGSIAAGNVVTSVSVGTLPSLTIATPATEITGTVGTALTSTPESWYAVAESQVSIDVAGAYSLTSDTSVSGGLTFASAGTYTLADGSVTIPANTFVVDVNVSVSE